MDDDGTAPGGAAPDGDWAAPDGGEAAPDGGAAPVGGDAAPGGGEAGTPAPRRSLPMPVAQLAGHVRSWGRDVLRCTSVSLAVLACATVTAAVILLPAREGFPPGALWRSDASLLAPAAPALLLWPLIVLGLLGYAVHQWLPSQRHSERQRNLGWLVAGSAALGAGWLSAAAETSARLLPLLTGGLLIAVLLWAFRRLDRHPAETRPAAAASDVTLGLLLGWAMTMALIDTGALLTDRDAGAGSATAWAVAGLAVLAVAVSAVCMTDRGRLSVAAAAAWLLSWVALERLWGEPSSSPVALAAGLAAFLVLVSAGSRRHQVNVEARRVQRIADGYAVDREPDMLSAALEEEPPGPPQP
jgi:hypothetical protein